MKDTKAKNYNDREPSVSTIDLSIDPAYVNFSGTVPNSILLEFALEDPCNDVKKMNFEMATWRGSGEQHTTNYGVISGYEDLDTVQDSD